MKLQFTDAVLPPTWNGRPSKGDIARVRSVVESVLRRALGTQDPEFEDVLQTALARVVETLEQNTFRGNCPLSAWAALIARKTAADSLRERYRKRRLFGEGDPTEILGALSSADAGPEHLALVREQLRWFTSALSGLRVGNAQVVYLYDVLGYELAEISAMIRISVAAAQSRLVRGRREIASRMKPSGVETSVTH
jgi:RNA polymerase sigma-70 factor (ECF subfamily)